MEDKNYMVTSFIGLDKMESDLVELLKMDYYLHSESIQEELLWKAKEAKIDNEIQRLSFYIEAEATKADKPILCKFECRETDIQIHFSYLGFEQ